MEERSEEAAGNILRFMFRTYPSGFRRHGHGPSQYVSVLSHFSRSRASPSTVPPQLPRRHCIVALFFQ